MRTLLAAVVFAVLVSGCSEPEDTSPPVARATFSVSKPRVAFETPVDFTYKFETLPGVAGISGDYFVFVHILDADGGLLWQDDHMPPVPTSQWKPGQTIGPYTRMRFVPRTSYAGPVSAVIGLYRKGESRRLKLEGAFTDEVRAKRQEYEIAKFEIAATSPEDLLLVRKDGWYEEDADPGDPMSRSRWTKKSATIAFRNPRKDVTLLLDSSAQRDVFPEPQTVTITANGQPVTTFSATNLDAQLRKIPISAAQLGNADMIDLRIEVDRAFIPAKVLPGSRDVRELGLRIYHLYIAQ
jgi:hypothetical protein